MLSKIFHRSKEEGDTEEDVAGIEKKKGDMSMSPETLATFAQRLDLNPIKFEDLTILQTLGTGTFGRVRLAKLKNENRYIALKQLKKAEVVRLKQVEHVKAERQLLADVNHPFIVRLFNSFQDGGSLFLLMEYVNGGELFYHLRRRGRFPIDWAQFYAAEIVEAFGYLHSLDIIYRDLKPENLLLDSNGHLKITDFGFAKKVASGDRTWTLCGTPEYLAPEVILRYGHGKAVDWWSLGILIFEMLAGFPPFVGQDPMEIYEEILAGKISFPNHFDSTSKDLISKLLTADRSRRLGSSKRGVKDIKQHKFFKGVEWELLGRKEGPILPEVAHDGDTNNFERYDEEPLSLKPLDPNNDQYKDLFDEF
eukprot:TRINITY_DN4926_c0_g2_i2.p2 TRINITY_DN4926_c0_g2~~TRINITY_DN4926_c0_g2_i2.p2  ORF type:complete len:365 (+),score=85.72 TRINITY_DN4926_c0_g2_i2:53-1147(+)